MKSAKIKRLPKLEIGSKVTRYLAGEISMPMEVLAINDRGNYVCGGAAYPKAEWEFEPDWGIEVDEEIDKLVGKMGMPKGAIVSWIVPWWEELT